MLNPCHPGETLRDDLEGAGLAVTEAAGRVGCARQAPARLLSGKARISSAMAIALERMGWSNAACWMRCRPPTSWRGSGRGRPPEGQRREPEGA